MSEAKAVDPIVVPDLTVRIVTGPPSDDPHGQGFSAIYAEVEISDKALIERLTSAKGDRTSLTLRCAMLDVCGPITKSVPATKGIKFVLAVQDLCYHKPKHFWEK
jgi:hypothetical protein